MRTSLGTICMIFLIQFAVFEIPWRLQFITYFIVQFIYMKWKEGTLGQPLVLEKTFMIKIILISRYFLYLAFLQIMMHQIYIFWMLPSHIYCLLKDLTSFLLTLESFERLAFFNIYLNTTDSNNSSSKT